MKNTFKSSSIQNVFNETKGVVVELNKGEEFCSVTLEVGHSNKRNVNFNCKRKTFDAICNNIKVGDNTNVRFFPTSNFKYNRWYSSNNILEVIKL